MTPVKPTTKPASPFFSSGPCAKRPGWSTDALQGAFLARSHRAPVGKKLLQQVIEQHRKLLDIPADYKIGIVPASDTGAVEMCLWSMLGARGVDVLSFEAFSGEWANDIQKHLKITDVRVFDAPYGALPDVTQISPDRDIVFVWNGTTSGVCVPNGNWIDDARTGLTICDATSAVFAYEMPWNKLDVTTWSWQKVIGGEAAHGMVVLSPRAVERLQTYTPSWPLPKIFRMTKGNVLMDGVFAGETINTPSMLCVADCLDALNWVEGQGGWRGTRARCVDNARTLREWVAATPWIDDLAVNSATASITSVCLKIIDPTFTALSSDDQSAFIKKMVKLIEEEGAGFDIAAYRDAPPGLRIWCGATVQVDDIRALTLWITWAFETVRG